MLGIISLSGDVAHDLPLLVVMLHVMWPGIIWWCSTWPTTAWFYVVMLHVMWPHSHCLIMLFLYYICYVIFFLHPLLDLCCNFCASCDFLWPQIVGYRLPYVSLGSDYSLHVLIISIVSLLSANHILCFLLLYGFHLDTAKISLA